MDSILGLLNIEFAIIKPETEFDVTDKSWILVVTFGSYPTSDSIRRTFFALGKIIMVEYFMFLFCLVNFILSLYIL